MTQRMTPAEIALSIGMNRKSLESYLNHASIREVLGGSGDPPTYPRTSLPVFERLRNLHAAQATVPGALAKTPERLALEEDPRLSRTSVPDDLGDGFVTDAEAAKYFFCTVEEVGRYVPLVHMCRMSDIEDAIRNALRQKYGD